MRLNRSPIALILVASLSALSAVLQAPLAAADVRQPASEVRALWVTRTTLTSPAAVAQMVKTAQTGGFNTLLVQVRGRGDAYYQSTLEPRPSELVSRPDFNPLAEVLALSRTAGLKVHAWINVNLVSSATELPGARQHIIYRQPEWLMVPRELAPESMHVDSRSPEYVGRLARWTRAHGAEVEGLYTSAIQPAAAAHIAAVASEIVTNYDVDGVHIDYARFPNEDFDYSRPSLQQFKAWLRPKLTDAERRRAETQETIDPLAYTNLFPEHWTSFRQSRLTTLVMRIRTAVKAVRPTLPISAAVVARISPPPWGHECRIGARGWISRWSTCCARWPTRKTPKPSSAKSAPPRTTPESARSGPGSAPIVSARPPRSNTSAPRVDRKRRVSSCFVRGTRHRSASAASLAELGRAAFGAGSR